MRRLNLFSLIFVAALIVISLHSATFAQTPFSPQEAGNPPRPNLLEELDLSPDQILQIRRLNQQRRPVLMEAQQRFREANRLLDAAIYADTENDSEIQTRLKEVQSAQAELIRIRTMNERAIRKILSPEQLVRFRELRSEFDPAQRRGPLNRQRNRRQKLRGLPRNDRIRPALNNRRPI